MARRASANENKERLSTAEWKELAERFERNLQLVDRVVWTLGLATYEENRQLIRLLSETGVAAHEVVFRAVLHYLGKVDPTNPQQGEAIVRLAEVLKFTGEMTQAYSPVTRSDVPRSEQDSKDVRIN